MKELRKGNLKQFGRRKNHLAKNLLAPQTLSP